MEESLNGQKTFTMNSVMEEDNSDGVCMLDVVSEI
jgi:hypothetical protein